MAEWNEELDASIDACRTICAETRRYLHAHPEPSREEFRTAEFLAARLHKIGLPCRLIPSRRGIIAEPERDNPLPRVAFRADIDALNIHDLKDVPYRSTVDGVMHACGHDAHATMAHRRGTALWTCRADSRGTFRGGSSSNPPKKPAKARSK